MAADADIPAPDARPADKPDAGPADGVAAPPALPVQATLYILPDGRVAFGALFDALVPVARALDPAALPDALAGGGGAAEEPEKTDESGMPAPAKEPV
jgi:hypothetical protein